MGWLDELVNGRWSDLLTCVVERQDGFWEVSWASDGRVPDSFKDHGLSAVVDQAAAKVAAIYSGTPHAAKGELQFAIYPWEGNPGKVILDITSDGDRLVARDIQGTGITIPGSSLEDLVQKGETMVPNPRDAMFRWIRRVSDLEKS